MLTSIFCVLLFLSVAYMFYRFVIARKYNGSSNAPSVVERTVVRYRNRTWSRRLDRRCVAIARAKDAAKMRVLLDPAFYRSVVR